MTQKIALVTGGNKGIGFEICKQLLENGLFVILTSRNKEKGLIAIEKLKKISNKLYYLQIDLDQPATFLAAKKSIDQQFGKLDILINNAGINLEASADETKEVSALRPNYDDIIRTFEINTVGTLALTNTLLSLMFASNDARIINVSSSMAQLKNMDKGSIGYRFSKTCLNVMTKVLAAELKGTTIKINAISPGWVKTDMGGPNARLPVEDAIDSIIWLATKEILNFNGKFIKDRKEIEW